MTIEKVNPVIIDEIEFYISNDGNKTGMSISGLARFIGIAESTLRKGILSKLSPNGSGEVKPGEISESLEPFIGKVFIDNLAGVNKAKIIDSELCEALIYYVAYETTTLDVDTVKQARKAHRAFARYGLHNYIKTNAGYIEQNNETALVSELRLVIGELKQLQDFASEYKVIRNTTTAFMPGVKDLLDEIAETTEDDNLYLPTEDGALSIEGWLHRKGISLTSTKFRQLAHITAATFKTTTKQDPSKAHFKLVNGKTKYNVSVYEPQHFAIIQMCFNKILHDD